MNDKKKTIIIFAIFFALLLFQIHFVWLYYDDYGYASLSYLAGYTGNRGMEASLMDVFSFLNYHYNHWGGRVLWFFLEIVLLRFSIHSYRIVQAIITTAIFYMIYKIVTKIIKKEDWKIALSSIICFGLVDLMILRDTFYWFTASVLYLLPILPLFILIYLMMEEKRKISTNIICIILAFIASWSQEQVSIYITSYLILKTLHDLFILKQKSRWNIAITVSSIIGLLILMLAPGSGVRMDYNQDFYNLSLIKKVFTNLPLIIENNFGGLTKIFTLMFFACVLFIIYKNKNSFKNKWMIDIGLINVIFIMLFNMVKNEGYFSFLYSISKFSNIIKLISFVQLGYIFLILFICFYKKKEYILSFLIVSAALSQLSMIMAPYFPMRSTTMLEFTTYIIFVYTIAQIIKDKKINIKYLLIPISLISIYNYSTNTLGYINNNGIKKENDRLLRDASKRIKKGEKIKEVELVRINELYGVVEPKDTYYLMKHYYEIPLEVDVHYKD